MNTSNCLMMNELDHPVTPTWVDSRISTIIGHSAIIDLVFTGHETLLMTQERLIMIGGRLEDSQ